MFLDDLTILIVARSNHPGEGFHLLFGPGAANNQIRYDGSTELLSVGTGNGLPVIVSPIGNNKVAHSLSIRHDGATWDVYRDGGPASSTPVAGPLDLGKLGAWFGTQHGLIGDIAEVLVYNIALTDEERLVAEDYLRNKYALPSQGGSTTAGMGSIPAHSLSLISIVCVPSPSENVMTATTRA